MGSVSETCLKLSFKKILKYFLKFASCIYIGGDFIEKQQDKKLALLSFGAWGYNFNNLYDLRL